MFTDPEVVSIRFHLGYTSQQDAFVRAQLSYLSTDAETKVRSILADLDAIDVKLRGDVVDVAGISKVSSIEFFEGQTINDLQSLRSHWLSHLSKMTDLEIVSQSSARPFSYFF